MRTVLALAPAFIAAGCGRGAPEPSAPDPMVRTLVLPDIAPPDLPDAPGRAMVYAACSTCHTPRYVLEQPRLPRRVWVAEVDKMLHAYGAPVPADMVPSIIDYLVVVRGADE